MEAVDRDYLLDRWTCTDIELNSYFGSPLSGERLVGPSTLCHIVTIFSTQSSNLTALTFREQEHSSSIEFEKQWP